jgi:hypothetical protein
MPVSRWFVVLALLVSRLWSAGFDVVMCGFRKARTERRGTTGVIPGAFTLPSRSCPATQTT